MLSFNLLSFQCWIELPLFSCLFLGFLALELEPRASASADKCSATELHCGPVGPFFLPLPHMVSACFSPKPLGNLEVPCPGKARQSCTQYFRWLLGLPRNAYSIHPKAKPTPAVLETPDFTLTMAAFCPMIAEIAGSLSRVVPGPGLGVGRIC